MGDKVSPGSPMRISASDWNGMLDLLAWWKRNYGTLGSNQPRPSPKNPDNLARVFVKNNSAANRRQGEVLKLGTLLTTDVKWKGLNHFNGSIPSSTGDRIGVLLQPITYGTNDVGLCQLSGVVPAIVDMQTSGDDWCSIDPSSAVLISGSSGKYPILHAPSGTGEKQCVIMLETPAATVANVGIVQMNKEFLISDGSTDTTLEPSEFCAIGKPKITADVDILGGDVTVKYNANTWGVSPVETFLINTDGVYEFEVHLSLAVDTLAPAGGKVYLTLCPGSGSSYMIAAKDIVDPAYDRIFTIIGKQTGYYSATTELSFGLLNDSAADLTYPTQTYAGPQVKVTRHDHVANMVYYDTR